MLSICRAVDYDNDGAPRLDCVITLEKYLLKMESSLLLAEAPVVYLYALRRDLKKGRVVLSILKALRKFMMCFCFYYRCDKLLVNHN